MTWDEIQRNYPDYQASLQQHFSKLTSDDVEQGANSKDALVSRISERYGYSENQAQQELETFAEQQSEAQQSTT